MQLAFTKRAPEYFWLVKTKRKINPSAGSYVIIFIVVKKQTKEKQCTILSALTHLFLKTMLNRDQNMILKNAFEQSSAMT